MQPTESHSGDGDVRRCSTVLKIVLQFTTHHDTDAHANTDERGDTKEEHHDDTHRDRRSLPLRSATISAAVERGDIADRLQAANRDRYELAELLFGLGDVGHDP